MPHCWATELKLWYLFQMRFSASTLLRSKYVLNVLTEGIALTNMIYATPCMGIWKLACFIFFLRVTNPPRASSDQNRKAIREFLLLRGRYGEECKKERPRKKRPGKNGPLKKLRKIRPRNKWPRKKWSREGLMWKRARISSQTFKYTITVLGLQLLLLCSFCD